MAFLLFIVQWFAMMRYKEIEKTKAKRKETSEKIASESPFTPQTPQTPQTPDPTKQNN